MDLAGTASARHPLTRIAAIFVLLICCPNGMGQPRPIDPEIIRVKEFLAQERWQEIVSLAQSVPSPSAELDFYLGTALARLGRWEEARKAFQAGARLRPSDERFPLELAGVAFKQKLYPEAARYLHRALELAPGDSYANDFLGTVYFLQENPDAALKYWNRIAKPQIAEILTEPTPRLDPVLLDRAFAFSPASTLQLADLRTTQARIDTLGIFPRYHFDLQAREDSKFSLLFRNQEKNGWGRNKWEGLILLFRGLPWQSIDPEFYNLRHRAINLVSMWRWDAEKRRLTAALSAPLGREPGREYGVSLDLRSENWNIRNSFSPGSNRSAVCLRCQWPLELVCRRRTLSSRFSQRDPRNCTQPKPARARLPAQTTRPGGRGNLEPARKKNHAQGRPVVGGWSHLVETRTCVSQITAIAEVPLVPAVPRRRL